MKESHNRIRAIPDICRSSVVSTSKEEVCRIIKEAAKLPSSGPVKNNLDNRVTELERRLRELEDAIRYLCQHQPM